MLFGRWNACSLEPIWLLHLPIIRRWQIISSFAHSRFWRSVELWAAGKYPWTGWLALAKKIVELQLAKKLSYKGLLEGSIRNCSGSKAFEILLTFDKLQLLLSLYLCVYEWWFSLSILVMFAYWYHIVWKTLAQKNQLDWTVAGNEPSSDVRYS